MGSLPVTSGIGGLGGGFFWCGPDPDPRYLPFLFVGLVFGFVGLVFGIWLVYCCSSRLVCV